MNYGHRLQQQATVLNLRNMLSEKSLTQKTTYCKLHFYEMFRKGKYIETEIRLVAA